MTDHLDHTVIDEFRARNGRVGGPFEGARLLLLTTTGARTGTRHTTALGYLPDGGDRVLVIASAGGSPRHPDWYLNLLAQPQVTVERGPFTYEAHAVPLAGEERDRSFARAVEADPGWARYQEKAGDRTLPVVALYESAAPPDTRAGSTGEAIRRVHDDLRHELALIRAEMARSTGPTLGAQLRVNCLTFCQCLHQHTGQDTGLFPRLADRHPVAAPAPARPDGGQQRIATLADELKQAVWTAAGPAEARAEFERIASELEAHLTYGEEQVVPLLDRWTD
ncbi:MULTISPECIES: nitroreductase/quinone reductase family protein [unclassified Streptomyces]|uniref:nitroreductase/quinone reductase family protein n=1 Tax=unclassified Streptomyces TaxID=2593676 RepID=UPI0036E4540F